MTQLHFFHSYIDVSYVTVINIVHIVRSYNVLMTSIPVFIDLGFVGYLNVIIGYSMIIIINVIKFNEIKNPYYNILKKNKSIVSDIHKKNFLWTVNYYKNKIEYMHNVRIYICTYGVFLNHFPLKMIHVVNIRFCWNMFPGGNSWWTIFS